jgi:hypothetical protein
VWLNLKRAKEALREKRSNLITKAWPQFVG